MSSSLFTHVRTAHSWLFFFPRLRLSHFSSSPFPQLALYVLSFLEPKDLLQAAQTCRYWRILAEDNLLWREKCREEGDCFVLCSNMSLSSFIIRKSQLVLPTYPPPGIDEPLPLKKRKIVKPGFTHSPWKSAYIRQHRIDTNWRRGDLKSPKVAFPFSLSPSIDQRYIFEKVSGPQPFP